MNWTTLQTHSLAPDKAFEMLCNQLFENWCKEKYTDDLVYFSFVNGAGGDGGVEAYAVLSNNSIIGVQAKWFPSSISSSQINQIKKSINTALKIRPEIKKYIVCVPRDLASITAKGNDSEEDRWNKLIQEVTNQFPDLSIELWNDTKITSELQKPNNAGICRFWFEKSEISKETLAFVFEKAKKSWLHTKYEPDLNVEGDIDDYLNIYLGDIESNRKSIEIFETIISLCEKFSIAARELLDLCGEKNNELSVILKDTSNRLSKTMEQSYHILEWLHNDTVSINRIDISLFDFYFDSIIERINHNKDLYEMYFHKRDVTKLLKKLSEIDIDQIISNINIANSYKSVLFIGNPGTGKTHGVGAFSNRLLSRNLHLPLIIPSKYIADDKSWKEIIQNSIGLCDDWDEEELWQGLTSLVNRNKFFEENNNERISITPKFLIIIDGLDEHSTKDKWLERIKESDVITQKYPQIRFCFTARPSIFTLSHNDINVVRLKNDGDTAVDRLFDKYLEAYKINAENKGWLKQALSTPLALKLFCEINRNKTVNYTTHSEVAVSSLWRRKIENLENEYCSKEGVSPQNQYIFNTVVLIAELLVGSSKLERKELIKNISQSLSISESNAERIAQFLDSYGLITCYCEHGTGIEPDRYYYYSGIQGYFDYAIAESLLTNYHSPENIDFTKCKALNPNYLYSLAVISIQKYGYLITQNQTIDEVLDEYSIEEIQYYALQHTDCKTALPFVERTKEIMSENASALILIVNKLILHFSRYDGHPLGVSLLDEYLSEFELPAQRDIFWSVCGYLKDAYDTKWYQNELMNLQDEKYKLSPEDNYSGCPTIYAWALSTNNNSMRKLYRKRLMEWSLLVPDEFYELFLKFAFVNDPQIRSDIFSVLMCVLFECSNISLLKKASTWLCKNILAPDKIDDNRDLAVRYYSIAIVRKAVSLNVIPKEEATIFLPPYKVNNYKITLNKDALNGTRMGGYSAINYDLARYVLIDHIESAFCDYCHSNDRNIIKLLKNIEKEQPEYKGITFEQFIISTAYSYINQMGWNKKEFYNYSKNDDGKVVKSVDTSILGTYYPKDHGIQSPIMTICEKYIWQFRKYISGYLCDRLNLEQEDLRLIDYGLIDDFSIPSQEINLIDPDNIPEDRQWYIPEKDKVLSSKKCNSKNDIINNIKNPNSIDWYKWVVIDNNEQIYNLNSNKLLALNMYSCFYDSTGIETNLFINSIIIDRNNITEFIELLQAIDNPSNTIFNPTDWCGGIESSCYITPKEICWFPWKKRYDSDNTKYFPTIKMMSAIDKCVYNYNDIGDVYYDMPSKPTRDALQICNTDGYNYWDIDNNLKAEYSIIGEKWGEYQQYLLTDCSELLNRLDNNNRTVIWIMKEYRHESAKSNEKYGKFYAENTEVSIGYFEGDRFITKKIKSEFLNGERNI